jgi:DNA (cytosine-5)-methyltransferase 1
MTGESAERVPRPRLLDLFCGAGGAAMGYHRAGFEVVGVDIEPQPRYPFEFIRYDALEWMADREWLRWASFDAIHASPPCQHYANVTRWRGNQDEHPDLIADTRELLEATGLPYVIENVRTDQLRADFMLCGTVMGLPIRRHRYFETNWSGLVMSHGCQHRSTDYSFDHGAKQPESVYRDAMGCEWMTVEESREAIPPKYTERIGVYLLSHLHAQAVA